jgi:hypothetical protein
LFALPIFNLIVLVAPLLAVYALITSLGSLCPREDDIGVVSSEAAVSLEGVEDVSVSQKM